MKWTKWRGFFTKWSHTKYFITNLYVIATVFVCLLVVVCFSLIIEEQLT